MQKMQGAFFVLSFLVCIASAFPVSQLSSITTDQLVKMRCSLNVADETLFFFNGSIVAYTPDYKATVLFKTIGLNIGRCFKNQTTGVYTLASRELMYYVDPVTDKIVDTWTNPWTGDNVTVVHVDNDPVLQTFYPGAATPVIIAGDNTILTLDIPLSYPNALYYDPRMAPYSPQPTYQAGEFFKFISPSAQVFGDGDTVSVSLVSWTRVGPWLPWMKQGAAGGNLLYSSEGSKLPDWTYLPESVKADLTNRIPWYKSAPICIPNAKSVTSWTFFQAHFNDYLAGAKFPIAPQANYSCIPMPDVAPSNACRATAAVSSTASWSANGEQYNTFNIVLTNLGTKSINSISINIDNTVLDNVWNIVRVGSSNVHSVNLWNPFQSGTTLSSGYGFNSHAGEAVVSVVSVRCN